MTPPEESRDTDPTIAYVPPRPRGADEPEHTRTGYDFALIVARGPRAGLAFLLHQGSTGAGRSTQAGIFLDDITVSRRHARFTVDGQTLNVIDEGSTNGTYVNGTRVESSQLHPGDEVIIGKYHLVVADGDG